MQDFVANEIGNGLLSHFGSATGQYWSKRGTVSEEAYRTYLTGTVAGRERERD
jgi:hypothetical protein